MSFCIKTKTPFRCRPRNIAATSPIVFNSPSCLAKRSATILVSHFRFAPDRNRQQELLDQVNLPKDYLTKSIASLSGGEKQRVALIRNLMFKPAILLLDEVTTGLDAQNKQIVHQLIANYRQTGTILAITHDPGELAKAEKIITVKGGQINE